MPSRKKTENQNSKKQTRKKRGYEKYDQKGRRQVIAWVGPVVIGLISLFASLLYSTHVKLAIWCIVVAVIALFGYLWFLLEWHIWQNQQTRKNLRIAFVLLSIITFLAGYVWQSRIFIPRRWLELSDEQKVHFITALKSQQPPLEPLKLGCAAMSEETCASSSKFLDLFKRGGWTVQADRIERVTPTKPITGVVLFKYGHADAFDPSDPDQGKWVKLSSSLQTIRLAFAKVGIVVTMVSDEQMPRDVIGVFFGIEPKD